MKLVADWKQSYKWLSIHAMAFNLAVVGTWSVFPTDLRDALPHWVFPAVSGASLVAGIFGRLVKQGDSDVQ